MTGRGLPWLLIVVYIAAGLVVACQLRGGLAAERERALQHWSLRVESVAATIEDHVNLWLSERRRDCLAVAGILPECAGGDLSGLGARVVLTRVKEAYGYLGAYIITSHGEVINAAPGSAPLPDDCRRDQSEALARGQWVVDETHLEGETIHLGFVTPIGALDYHGLDCAVVLLVDARAQLVELLSETVPTRTGESLLAAKAPQGGIIFITPLRHWPQQPVPTIIEHPDTRLAARSAVEGNVTTSQFVDYRGHEVLATTRRIEATGWGVVRKVDLEEVLAGYSELAGQYVRQGVLAVLGLGCLLFGVWAQQRSAHYRRQLELERRLQEETDLIAGILESTEALTVATDASGHITRFNAACRRLTGQDDRSVLGQPVWEVLGSGLRAAVLEVCRSGGVAEARLPLTTAAGGERLIDWRLTQLVYPGGGLRGVVATGIDVTARQRAEGELRRLNEELEHRVRRRTAELEQAHEQLLRSERLSAIGQLAGSLAHELRNPLGVISNALYYLRLVQPEAAPKVREYLDIIGGEVNQAQRVISELLDFVRLPRPRPQPVVLAGLVEEALRRERVPPQVVVRNDIPSSAVAWADPHQLRQVLANLITNAFQAMPDGGTLVFAAQTVAAGTELLVSDTGCGIPGQDLERIFQPLFTTKSRGIGLGLSISRALVEANGGTLTVTSEVGKGSTFAVYLPREEAGAS